MLKKSDIAVLMAIVIITFAFDTFALTPLDVVGKSVSLILATAGFIVFAFYYKSFPQSLKQYGILFAVN